MGANTKSAKKRSVPFADGVPEAKKAHLDKGKGKKTAKPSAPAKAPAPAKSRSKPITKSAAPDTPSESEEEFDEEGFSDADQAMAEEGDEDGGDDMDVDEDGKPPKDPNAARESHKAQRALHAQRKASKPHSDLLSSAKQVWALARQHDIPAAERKKHIHDLMEVIRGHIKEVVLKHDASRIVQTVVKYGGQKERDEIAAELKGEYVKLAQSRYSKFLVTKLIRLCPTHRSSILTEFQGNVIRLLLHREATSVLADAFELYANAYERSILLRDFYGKEIALFGGTLTKGSDADKEKAKKGLIGYVEGVDGDRRKRLLAAVKENLVTIFNNPDKGAVTHAIVHRALWEYLTATHAVEDRSEREKLFREVFETCQDVLAEMVHTKDGSRAVREFIVRGTAKDRKHIVKALKPHIERMCLDDEAQLVLFTCLDVIDDTKLLAKSIVAAIAESTRTLLGSPQGRRALLYLIVPRSTRHFTPAQVRTIRETDEVRDGKDGGEGTSKKDAELRRKEVREAASEELIKGIVVEGKEAWRDPGGSLVVGDVMLYAEGDKSAAIQTLVTALCEPYPSPDESKPHPIDLPHASRMYKTLMQGGHFDHSSKSISRSPFFSPSAFASAFVRTFSEGDRKDVVLAMAKGDGAFLIAELCERIREEGSAEQKRTVGGWFGPKERDAIEASEVKGKKVLLEKITTLQAAL